MEKSVLQYKIDNFIVDINLKGLHIYWYSSRHDFDGNEIEMDTWGTGKTKIFYNCYTLSHHKQNCNVDP